MNKKIKKFPKHACQNCGCERKFVETIIDDEFSWNPKTATYESHSFTDMFKHTGNQRCAECEEEWSGF